MIRHLSGRWACLSNFWEEPFWFNGDKYPTAEHAYQAQKSEFDLVRQAIRDQPTPAAAKRMGRSVKLRPGWDAMRVGVMYRVVLAKFHQLEGPRCVLMATKGTIEEGNNWGDRFWGVVDGEGLNWLGRLLMSAREEFRINSMTSKGMRAGG